MPGESVPLTAVTAGSTPKSGRRDWALAHNGLPVASVAGPTPGSGWLKSSGATRCVALWPTYAAETEVEFASRYSSVRFHCCVNCGRRLGFQMRINPDGTFLMITSVKPLVIEPAPVESSYGVSASEKNGELSGSRRFDPVPSMYCVMP